MVIAYTLYKYKKLVGLVLIIFILLIVASQFNPEVDKAKRQMVDELDETGIATTAMDIKEGVPDPEGEIKQKSGNYLLNLLNENPEGFLLLGLVVAGVLFFLGIRLSQVRSFARGILRV
tara:strand:- start:1908 stop:2264 length:357 start_codon:yes stop_codon:yes gene_type:complete